MFYLKSILFRVQFKYIISRENCVMPCSHDTITHLTFEMSLQTVTRLILFLFDRLSSIIIPMFNAFATTYDIMSPNCIICLIQYVIKYLFVFVYCTTKSIHTNGGKKYDKIVDTILRQMM